VVMYPGVRVNYIISAGCAVPKLWTVLAKFLTMSQRPEPGFRIGDSHLQCLAWRFGRCASSPQCILLL
jgi:hypothetical protein